MLHLIYSKIGSMLEFEKKKKFTIMETSQPWFRSKIGDGLKFDIDIFKIYDHLDYHKNMKNYLNSNLYLFKFKKEF